MTLFPFTPSLPGTTPGVPFSPDVSVPVVRSDREPEHPRSRKGGQSEGDEHLGRLRLGNRGGVPLQDEVIQPVVRTLLHLWELVHDRRSPVLDSESTGRDTGFQTSSESSPVPSPRLPVPGVVP